MKLSDVMSGLGLAGFPIVAMGLFLAVFAGVFVSVLRRSNRGEFNRAAMLPLDEAECGARVPAQRQMQKEAGR